MFHLIKKHTDTPIERTKTKPQKTVDFKLNKLIETVSFNPPTNLAKEGKWLLAVISFETTNSVFNVTDENKSFSITTLGHWNSEGGEELINKLNILLELRSENDIELFVKQVEKGGIRIEQENSGYNLAGFDYFKGERLAEFKRSKYKNLEGMVYRMGVTYDEIADILVVKKIGGSTIGYTLPPRIYEASDNNLMIKFLLPNKVKVINIILYITLKSNLTTNKTIRFTKKSFSLIY